MMCFITLTIHAQDIKGMLYVDLGLPSGTLWGLFNENNDLFSYDDAKAKYGQQLPSRKQWEELREKCIWQWKGDGYKVTGPNNRSIYIPAKGWCNCYGNKGEVLIGSHGAYWTSSFYKNRAWGFSFDSSICGIGSDHRCSKRSVRLILNKQ